MVKQQEWYKADGCGFFENIETPGHNKNNMDLRVFEEISPVEMVQH